MSRVTSKDGTPIAYYRQESWPAISCFQFSTVVDARNSFSNARSQLRVKCLNAATAADTRATATHTLTKPSRYIKIIRLIHSICSPIQSTRKGAVPVLLRECNVDPEPRLNDRPCSLANGASGDPGWTTFRDRRTASFTTGVRRS
jgi:hypothetical protein